MKLEPRPSAASSAKCGVKAENGKNQENVGSGLHLPGPGEMLYALALLSTSQILGNHMSL